MRRYARFFALLSLSAAAFAQPPTIAWQHTFGGPYGNEEAYSVVQMTDGNYAAAGYSDGPLSAGMKDFYVVKFDGDGNPIWQHTYTYVGGQRDEICYSMAATDDNGLILAGVTQAEAGTDDILMFRTDGWGEIVWTRVLQGEGTLDDTHSAQVALDVKIVQVSQEDNHILLAGNWWSIDGTVEQPLLIQTDMQGNTQWRQHYQFFDNGDPLPMVCAKGVAQLSDNPQRIVFSGSAMDAAQNSWSYYATTDAQGNIEEQCWPGLELAVAPVVNTDGTISMIIRPEEQQLLFSGLVRTTDQCATLPLLTLPQSTLIRMTRTPDGNTLVVAGLYTDDQQAQHAYATKVTSNGDQAWDVSMLNDLPVVGSFFRGVQRDHNNSDLLIFVGARVINMDRLDDTQMDMYVVKMQDGAAGASDHVSSPTSYALSAYPNPFNPTTTISFSLPQASEVSLTVYDVLGQQVAQLVNGTLNAGEHRLTFEAANLPSGVYITRLATSAQTLTQKILLMK
jgi:hypothetical protein